MKLHNLSTIKNTINAFYIVGRCRGLRYLIDFIVNLCAEKNLIPRIKIISGQQKELLFQEKQIVGLGDFSPRMQLRLHHETQLEVFPKDLLEFFYEKVEQFKPNKITVLDIGSGIISYLVYGHNSGLFKLIAADILADEYKKLLTIYGHIDAIGDMELIQSPAETLDQYLNARSCDIVYCANALDHTKSPRLSLQCMVHITRIGGYIVITARSHEGTHEGWDEIHQHDLFLKDNNLWCAKKNGDVVSLLENLPLKVEYTNKPSGFHDRLVIILRRI